LTQLDILNVRAIPINTIGRIDPYSPGITHIYHIDHEKNTRGLPYYVVHASLDVILEAFEKVKSGDIYLEIPQTTPDYLWERKHKFNKERDSELNA